MKRKCYKCQDEKEIGEFKKKKKSNGEDGYGYICKICHNKERKQIKRDRSNEKFAYALNYKLTHACIVCGEADPVVLDFHHRDPNEKNDCISAMLNIKSCATLDDLKKEIDKCDLLCANDHRRAHVGKRMGDYLSSK